MAVLIALAAALLAGAGLVLQQRAAEQAPKAHFLRLRLFADLARRPRWLAGIAVMGVGQLLSIWALGHLELSVAEPLMASRPGLRPAARRAAVGPAAASGRAGGRPGAGPGRDGLVGGAHRQQPGRKIRLVRLLAHRSRHRRPRVAAGDGRPPAFGPAAGDADRLRDRAGVWDRGRTDPPGGPDR